MTPVLEVQGLTKTYGGVRALRGADLVVQAGEIHGLCGHNGAGKSTLIKSLLGLVKPDGGTVRLKGESVAPRNPRHAQSLGIAVVDQELSLVPQLSVQENLFLGSIGQPFFVRPSRGRRRALELLEELGVEVSPNEAVDSLSPGQRQLVEIARLLGRNAELLVFDEATAMLSEAEIQKVFSVIRRIATSTRGVIYVSHRLNEVLELCERVTVFRDGKSVGTHNTSALSRPELIQLIIGESGPDETRRERAHISNSSAVIEVEDLRVPDRVHGVSFSVRAGEIVGLAGQVGSGASEIVRALGGVIPAAQGDVRVSGKSLILGSPIRSTAVGAAYTPGDRGSEGLFLDRPISDNVLATTLADVSMSGVLLPRRVRDSAARTARAVGVDMTRVREPTGVLSGGNQQKVLIARSLRREKARALLLDDPTHGVDVAGRKAIHELIRGAAAEGRGILLASTETEELLDLADRIITIFKGRAVATYDTSEVSESMILADMTTGSK